MASRLYSKIEYCQSTPELRMNGEGLLGSGRFLR